MFAKFTLEGTTTRNIQFICGNKSACKQVDFAAILLDKVYFLTEQILVANTAGFGDFFSAIYISYRMKVCCGFLLY